MANSFKAMRVSGVIKRTDTGMFIRYEDIHVKEGFNKRVDTDKSKEENQSLFNFLMQGGQVPALEVIARDDGGVEIVEGHRRHVQYGKCIEAGKPIEWISITPFKGNDIERIARIMNSNSQLKLNTYEESLVVKELAGFNLTPVEIAKLVNVSRSKVDQLLAFNQANHDVQVMVRDGEVAMHVAVDKVKKLGDAAGEELKKDVEKAKASGKKRVTTSTVQFSAVKARRLCELLYDAQKGEADNGSSILYVEDNSVDEILAILAEYRSEIK